MVDLSKEFSGSRTVVICCNSWEDVPMGGFLSHGDTTIAGWFIGLFHGKPEEIYIYINKMDDFGDPYFRKPEKLVRFYPIPLAQLGQVDVFQRRWVHGRRRLLWLLPPAHGTLYFACPGWRKDDSPIGRWDRRVGPSKKGLNTYTLGLWAGF